MSVLQALAGKPNDIEGQGREFRRAPVELRVGVLEIVHRCSLAHRAPSAHNLQR